MRNLKKILALVLALVMSLSLMAVASADDELNMGDVSDIYAESVDVLTGLKVFQGNKGEFLPKDNITRAEVAAIIYRIVTGDVNDTQKGIYADYNKFSDVTSDAWYAGYVNYCANAEYVKGVGGGKFAPQQNVTGYEALAMILRAIGYDKNNEFTGSNWQIQTAATARNRGILKNIAEGTLGGAATREVVAEILCQTILVPVADYSLAFGYRTTDANGNDNPTLAYTTFKMEKISGVVVANDMASLEATTPLTAGQTKLNLADGASYTLNVASTLDDIGESRYVYVVPAAGTTRYDLVCSKVYDTGLNNVYDSGEPVTTVSGSTGSAEGITSITGAQHFVNYDQAEEYEAKIRIEYVIRLRMSQYDAMVLYNLNGTADNSALYPIKADGTVDAKIARPSNLDNANTWNTTITSNGYTMNGVNYDHTYEYHKVINAFTKLTQTDYDYIRTIFASADRENTAVGNYILGEVYVGTTSVGTAFVTIDANGNLVLSNTTRDVSDTMKWEDFVSEYLNVVNNKAQVTKNERGNRLKIVDNDNNGVADYILQTIYTVGIINAAGGLDVSGVKMPDGDSVNEVTAATKVINDGEGELATGNVVIYAKIDGNARAQLAATETAKINTVNRAAKTATAVDSTEAWNESWVHTHSGNLKSYVSNLVTNTTYTLYFDLYGNLAAFTEGDNGQFVLITDGWYNSTIGGGEYAVQTWVDGHLQTVNVTENGSLFIDNRLSGNRWGLLKTDFGNNNINYANGSNDKVHTIVANIENGVLTPVDKIYRYSARYDMIDMNNNVVPGRDNATTSFGTPYETNYANGTAYTAPVTSINNWTVPTGGVEVRALTTTTYYYVYRAIGNSATSSNVVVRTYTGFNSIPDINRAYIEDVYVVGQRAQGATAPYYTANVVVVELNDKYTGYMTDSEQVFIPDFAEVSSNLTIENVRMIRGTGVEETVKVDMRLSTLDYYDEAGNLIRNGRVPGLFYMDLADGSTDTYVIKRMDANDIRANNYMAGYIEKSNSTVGDNYAQVQMMVRPDSVPTNSYWTTFNAHSYKPEAASGDLQPWLSKSVVNDNLYTLSYASRNVATLTKADKAVVLAQNSGDAVNCTIADARNERWNYEPTRGDYFYGGSRNEVLVRYDAAGNVIWAVSFAEGTDTSINYAQTVWYNCLPAKNYDVDSYVKFWGVGDGEDKDRDNTSNRASNNVIIVDYTDALGKIFDINGLAATIKTAVLSRGNGGVGTDTTNTNCTSTRWTRMTDAEVDAATRDSYNAKVNGMEYKLDITTNTGASETYYLRQRAANTDNQLVSSGAGTTPKSAYWDGSTLSKPTSTTPPSTDPASLSINKYLASFVADDYRSTITFDIWQNDVGGVSGNADFTVTATLNADGSVNEASLSNDLLDRITTSELAALRVTVTSESGVARRYYKNFVDSSATDPTATETLTISGTGFKATYNGTEVTGSAKVSVNDKVILKAETAGTFYYRMSNSTEWQKIDEVAANAEYTWTVPGSCSVKFEAKADATVTPDETVDVDPDSKKVDTAAGTVEYTIEVDKDKVPTSENPNVSFTYKGINSSTGKAMYSMVISNVKDNTVQEVEVSTTSQIDEATGGIVTFTKGVKTITVMDAKTLGNTVEVDGEKVNIVLNANLTGPSEGKALTVKNNGELVLTGSGSVVGNGIGVIAGSLTVGSGVTVDGASSTGGSIITVFQDGGNVTIENGAVVKGNRESNGQAVVGVQSEASGKVKANVVINGELNGRRGFYVDGDIVDDVNDRVIATIGSTAVIDAKADGMYLAGMARTTVEDGAQITGGWTGIEVRGGYLTVNGSNTKIFGKTDQFVSNPSAGGATTDGAGIAVVQHVTANTVGVVVNGGTIQGVHSIFIADKQGNNTTNVTLSVADGVNLLNLGGQAGHVAKDSSVPEGYTITTGAGIDVITLGSAAPAIFAE